eukprot:12685509-Alexandrium_andersonii.AAC.1
MSASLVGSEMCIRDSACVHPRAGGQAVDGACGHNALVSADQVRIVEPVSYTHLTLPTICSV